MVFGGWRSIFFVDRFVFLVGMYMRLLYCWNSFIRIFFGSCSRDLYDGSNTVHVLECYVHVSWRVFADLWGFGEIVLGYVEVSELPFIEARFVLKFMKVISWLYLLMRYSFDSMLVDVFTVWGFFIFIFKVTIQDWCHPCCWKTF